MEEKKAIYNHGTIVNIDYEEALQDYSTIYIKGGEDLANKVRVALDSFDIDGCLFDYHVQMMDEFPECPYEQAIALPLYELNRSERRMIIIPVDGAMVDADVATLSHDAEELASEALQKGFENATATNPEALRGLLEVVDAEEGNSLHSISVGAISNIVFDIMPSIFGMDEEHESLGDSMNKKMMAFLKEKSKGNWIDNFITICKLNKETPTDQGMSIIKNSLKAVFGSDAVNAILYFLNKINDEKDYGDFARNFLDVSALAEKANVNVIVKHITDGSKIKQNAGSFQIFTQKENSPLKRLDFANKPTYIIYLMYLIDKYNRKDKALYMNLIKNKEQFNSLFHSVYGYPIAQAATEFDKLQWRIVDGKRRKGRINQCITDLRQKLAETFIDYQESYLPYSLSAKTHLAVPANKIIFEGDAIELTKITFL